MKGIYVKSKYTLLLALILMKCEKKIIYFLNEELKKEIYFDESKVIWIKEYKEFNYLIRKYKQWRLNNKLINLLENIEMIYLQDHISYSQFFLNNFNKNIYLLEDGTMNYNRKILEEENNREIKKIRINHFIKKVIIEKRKKDYKRFGLSEKIKKVYLTGLFSTPDLIKNKVEIINLSEKWEALTRNEQNEILEVFNISTEKLEKLRLEKGKVLLLTQPLSEDGIVTEEEKIEIYREIIMKQSKKNIYIKAHPREKTNYKEVFKEFNIKTIENSFPIEICLLLDIKFEKVITLFSTGALNFKGKSEIEFIGTKSYPKIYEQFGDIIGE
ncbi:hypothetical protein H9X75_08980 [Fusobacterium mortiferum]|uniref:glycosyltransferase family 52 n=1 Tax=Fusobacterium mortiferum TaxID=850 RepID=UPI00195AB136|nr:hypothetical protein [Fusobacterium mortiferum]